MNGNPERQPQEKPKAQVEFQKEGPKLSVVLKRPYPRGNSIKQTVSGPETGWKKVEKSFTERKGIENINAFLDKTIETATRVGNQEILNRATALKENLIYVGEPELQEALEGIARRVVEKAEAGESVLIYIPGLRSERYITTRVAEEVSKLTKDKKEIRGRVSVTESRKELVENTERIKQAGGKASIIIADDFAISGTRVRGFAGDVYKELVKKGFSPDEAVSLIEVNLVAAKVDKEYKIREKPLNVRAYYGAKTYKDAKGAFYVSGGISITGTHSSTDYGFEDPVEEFKKFLAEEGESFDLSLPTNIVRPYELQPRPSNKYLDSALQERWESTSQAFQYQAPPPPPPGGKPPEKPSVVKETAVGVAEKGAKKGAKKLLAKTAAGKAVGQVVDKAAMAVGSAIGGPVGAAIAKAISWIGRKALGLLKKVVSKVTDAIFGKRDKGKTIATIGALMLLGGILLPSALLASLGVLTLFVGGMVAVGGIALGAGVAAYFTAFFLAITTPARAFIAWLLVAIIAVLFLFVLIIIIINSGAYVVPQGPPSVSAFVENPYIGVEKLARIEGSSNDFETFLEFDNSDMPKSIEYQITVTAKRSTLTNISFDWRCSVISEDENFCPAFDDVTINGGSAPNVLPPDPPDLISSADDFVITYTMLFRAGQFDDSLILDTFSATADVESEGVTQAQAAASASVKIGDPPTQCPFGWPILPEGGEGSLPIIQGPFGVFSHTRVEAIDVRASDGHTITARHSGIARAIPASSGGVYGMNVRILSECEVRAGEVVRFESVYAHLSSIPSGTVGSVTLGQVIGFSGSSGTDNSHLHYEFSPRGSVPMETPWIPKDVPERCWNFAGTQCNVNIP